MYDTNMIFGSPSAARLQHLPWTLRRVSLGRFEDAFRTVAEAQHSFIYNLALSFGRPAEHWRVDGSVCSKEAHQNACAPGPRQDGQHCIDTCEGGLLAFAENSIIGFYCRNQYGRAPWSKRGRVIVWSEDADSS